MNITKEVKILCNDKPLDNEERNWRRSQEIKWYSKFFDLCDSYGKSVHPINRN